MDHLQAEKVTGAVVDRPQGDTAGDGCGLTRLRLADGRRILRTL